MNKHSTSIDPKGSKSNNLSLQNNCESINSPIQIGGAPKKMSKLEKYFKNTGSNVPTIRSSMLKGTNFRNHFYENYTTNINYSPKTAKENESINFLQSAYSSKRTITHGRSTEFSKSNMSFDKLDLSPLFELESHLFGLMVVLHNEEAMADTFLKYLEVVKSNDFEIFLSMIPSAAISEGFKNAFVLERMGLMICFYLSQKGLYEKELVFLKKIVVLAYSSFVLFLKFLTNDLAQSQLHVG